MTVFKISIYLEKQQCRCTQETREKNKLNKRHVNLPSRGVLLRYPALQEVTRSHIGIPASARAKVAALIHADLVPAENKMSRIQHNILGQFDYIFN
jgi:hypothetical protein